MFNKNYYVPILKWKRAEQGALETLTDECKDHLSPVIELVMPKVKTPAKGEEKKFKTIEDATQTLITEFRSKRISEIPNEIVKAMGTRTCFIDFSLLYGKELKVESIGGIFEKSFSLGAKLIPVLNLSDEKEIKIEIKNTTKKYDCGVCLKIVRSDLDNISDLDKRIAALLIDLDCDPSSIDLLIDLKDINSENNVYEKYFDITQKIDGLEEFRNFIFACGAFPENLSDFSKDEPGVTPRIEWLGWIEQRKKDLKRLPTFSDYTIRNPIYNESLQFYSATSSIKYALEEGWLILKGEVNKPEMYLASAAELIKDNRYYGEGFCSGDKFIIEKANHFENYIRNPKIKGTGNTEMWLKALINHHLSLTTHQLANLS